MSDVMFESKVTSVRERFRPRWIGGAGKDARFVEESLGWFVGLAGSHEVLFVGNERPDIEVGQLATVRITFYGRQ